GIATVESLNAFATGGLMPHLCFLLDLPESVGLGRVRRRIREDLLLQGVRRKVKLDRLESEKAEFHKRIRRGFLALAKKHPQRFAVIDASQTEAQVKEAILKEVRKHLQRRHLWKPAK
ncbi:MAG: dTMP kinase, partial [Verrucomicrobiales bacterium]